MNTSEIIRSLCKEKGISVKTLEVELGFSNGSLTKGTALRSDRLYEVAKYFGVPVEYLMTGKMPTYYYDEETAEMADYLFKNKEMRILFDAARGSSPQNLQLAAEMLKRFKETNNDG